METTNQFVVFNPRVKLYEANSPYETRDHFTTNQNNARVYADLETAENVARAINSTIGDGCWFATAIQ